METAQQSARSWITEGIILAGIPATAYVWALLYEMAYSQYFFIPWYFISLSSVNVLAIIRVYIIPLGLLYILLLTFIASRPLGACLDSFASRSPKNRVIVWFFMLLLLSDTALLWSFLENDRLLRIILRISAVLPTAVFFVRPLFRQRAIEGTYWDKLIADNTPQPKISTGTSAANPSPISAFRDVIEFLVILMTLVVITLGSYLFPTEGRKDAQGQEWFPVVAQSPDVPEVVVLRVYDDHLFATPFNRSTKEFEKKLFILKLSDMDKRPLMTEKVGPLVPPQAKP